MGKFLRAPAEPGEAAHVSLVALAIVFAFALVIGKEPVPSLAVAGATAGLIRLTWHAICAGFAVAGRLRSA